MNERKNTDNRVSSKKMSEKDKKIVDKWIFILFHVNNDLPIKGRLRITKILFSFAKEINSELWDAIQFFPYQFGPYSTYLGVRMNEMINEKTIIAKKKNQTYEYKLSASGKLQAELYMKEDQKESIDSLAKIKESYSNLTEKQIVSLIYHKYPDYASNSSIKNFVSPINEVKITSDDKEIKNDNDLVAFSLNQKEMTIEGEIASKFLEILKIGKEGTYYNNN